MKNMFKSKSHWYNIILIQSPTNTSIYKSHVGIENNKNKYAHARPQLNIVFD